MHQSKAPIPDHVPPELVVDFDHRLDPGFAVDPVGTVRKLHDGPDIVYSPYYGGHWIFTRHDDILEGLRRPEVFSSCTVSVPPQSMWQEKLIPLELDPPEHSLYRNVLARQFSPKWAQSFEKDVRAGCRAMIDGIAPRGECEFVNEMAFPLPVRMLMPIIGFPVEDYARFHAMADRFFHAQSPEQNYAAAGEVFAYMGELVACRRGTPGDDLISRLFREEVEGRLLTDNEILRMCFLLFMASTDTVTSATVLHMHYLATHPDKLQMLLDDPALIPDAHEELLRRLGFINGPSRRVMQDVEIKGVKIRKGDMVTFMLGLAGLDERVHQCPIDVDFKRAANPHLAFGGGPHRCVGSHLARVELRVMFEEWLPRMKNLRVKPGTEIRWHANMTYGTTALPLVWDV